MASPSLNFLVFTNKISIPYTPYCYNAQIREYAKLIKMLQTYKGLTLYNNSLSTLIYKTIKYKHYLFYYNISPNSEKIVMRE